MSTSDGEALLTQPPPRSPELAARIVATFAPWWGFAFYSIIFLALAAGVGSALIAGFVQSVTRRPATPALWIIGGAIVVPFCAYLLARWVRRRRGAFRMLAEQGLVQPVYIASIGSSAMLGSIVGSRNTGAVIWVTIGGTNYRAMVRGTRPWAQPGVPIGAIAIPGVSYALFLAPDEEVLLARESTD